MSDQGIASRRWHIDKTIPVALVIMLTVQTIIVGKWIGGIEERLAYQQAWINKNDGFGERLAVVEARIGDLDKKLDRIETKLDGARMSP